MIFERKNVPVVETNKTDRDYEAEFEDKAIEGFEQPSICMAYIINIDYMELWAFDTNVNQTYCMNLDGTSDHKVVSELNETLFREIEKFYGGINLYDFDVTILEEVKIDMPI